jgi:hypothetical protein
VFVSEVRKRPERYGLSQRLATVPSSPTFDRAYGRPPVAIDATTRELSLKKIIHEIRWLPPDPNDHSKVIEPEPD